MKQLGDRVNHCAVAAVLMCIAAKIRPALNAQIFKRWMCSAQALF